MIWTPLVLMMVALLAPLELAMSVVSLLLVLLPLQVLCVLL
jgi:hypothetical protein